MKKYLVKIITISSLFLVVSLFLTSVFFSYKEDNDMSFVINNNNLNKMDENTSLLFEKKEAEDTKNDEITEDVVDETEQVVEKLEDAIVEEKREEVVVEESKIEEPQKEEKEEQVVTSLSEEREVIQTVVGNLTGYGADCVGCSGITSSGFDLTKSIYYEDSEYGTVRILAADPSFPFYSIFRISNVPTMDDFIGIVLDRGGNVGFGRGTLFDLAYFSESDPDLVPLTRNVTFDLLRSGK